MAESMGIPQQMVDGRRITDSETLKIITMVYAGFINKNIVALLQSLQCNAIGLSGADGNVVLAHKRVHSKIDYGFVGDVDDVNMPLIHSLIQANAALVFSPITHNGKGVLLNTNADTIAQEIAKAMSGTFAVSLIYCFEKAGVLRNPADDDDVIERINQATFVELKENKVITAGMIPKLENAFAALDAGVKVVTIGSASDLHLMLEQKSGTSIVHE
jgi:acetylglutamate kinase